MMMNLKVINHCKTNQSIYNFFFFTINSFKKKKKVYFNFIFFLSTKNGTNNKEAILGCILRCTP